MMLVSSTSQADLDETDWRLIAELQCDARQSYTALGQAVGLSRPAVAERVRRLEDLGVIRGYRAVVDITRVGYSIIAFTRVSGCSRGDAAALSVVLQGMPEVQECFRATGEDCFIVKLAVQSIAHLDAVLEQVRDYGHSTTSVVLSELVSNRQVVSPLRERP
jgi:Lrp/AsnC family leucine-responsive transcriptional regulator